MFNYIPNIIDTQWCERCQVFYPVGGVCGCAELEVVRAKRVEVLASPDDHLGAIAG